MLRCKDGHLHLDCQEIEPRKSVWNRISYIVCAFALAYFIGHLVAAGIDRHMQIESGERKPFTGQAYEKSDAEHGYGYYQRRHERGR